MNFYTDNSNRPDRDFNQGIYEDSDRAHSFNLLKKTLIL